MSLTARAVTHGWSAADLRVHGNFARANFNHYNVFGYGWYHNHPNAWWAGYRAGVWTAATWAAVNSWFGYAWPIYGYDYGNDIVYENNYVYLYGQPIATTADYYQAATDLAQTGEEAQIPSQPPPTANTQPDPKTAKWLPLGVFEAIPPKEKSSKMMMQLAVNKTGIIRGNYYNTGDENTQLIEGSVDKKTARVAWVVTDKEERDLRYRTLQSDEARVHNSRSFRQRQDRAMDAGAVEAESGWNKDAIG